MDQGCRVSIIDRNEIARESLRRHLGDRDFKSIDSCADAYELCAYSIHLIVISMQGHEDALEACRQARDFQPYARIVILTGDCGTAIVMEALAAGADGVLSRLMPIAPLTSSLELIALGEKVIPSCFVESLSTMPYLRKGTGGSDLSAREMAVLDRIVAGRANKLISRDLGITEETVKVHVKSILRKLGVSNRTQAAMWAAGRLTPAIPQPHVISAMSFASESSGHLT